MTRDLCKNGLYSCLPLDNDICFCTLHSFVEYITGSQKHGMVYKTDLGGTHLYKIKRVNS